MLQSDVDSKVTLPTCQSARLLLIYLFILSSRVSVDILACQISVSHPALVSWGLLLTWTVSGNVRVQLWYCISYTAPPPPLHTKYFGRKTLHYLPTYTHPPAFPHLSSLCAFCHPTQPIGSRTGHAFFHNQYPREIKSDGLSSVSCSLCCCCCRLIAVPMLGSKIACFNVLGNLFPKQRNG